jgi:hypothetical protein
MNIRAKKIVLLLLAAVLLFGSGQMQKVLNRDREQLGLTRVDALDNAPPMLAFTTVALGGFRGLIANGLWIRANDLQQDDKFFEAVQLANWITDLEPHFAQVWAYQAWNMAWNISVQFKDFSDRWRWVQRGIELLRDNGLRYNPDDVLLYQQLGWIFQSKLGQNIDDANIFYKIQWAEEMSPFFGAQGTNFSELLNPQTAQARTNALVLRDKYKIDPAFAQKVDAQYGPLDWRLPEAHAIYWGARGLDAAKKNPDKVKADDLIQLRRLIYQSMLQSFHHGRIIDDPFDKNFAQEPDLEMVSKANEAWLFFMNDDPGNSNHMATAHRNFLKDAVYFLYGSNQSGEAAKWYKTLGETYPNKPILDNDTNSFPRNLTLDDYAVARVQEEIGDTSLERTTAVLENLLRQSYYALAIGQDDRSAGFKNLARKVYDHYVVKTTMPGNNENRAKLPSFDVLNRAALNYLLDTKNPVLPYAARAALRTQLIMPAETNAPPAVISTNAIVPTVLPNTNTPVSTNR